MENTELNEIWDAIKEVSQQTGQPEQLCHKVYMALGDVDKSIKLIEEAKKIPISIVTTEQVVDQLLIWCHNPILFEEVYLARIRIIENGEH